MTPTILVNLLVEDALCEALARRLLELDTNRFSIGASFMANGYGYIKNKLPAFNRASRGMPLFVLSDLVGLCPVTQIKRWLPHPHPNLCFRIAVKESESWILADRKGFAGFLGISTHLIPTDVDNITHPKQFLINLAAKSKRRKLRESILPSPGTTSVVGPDYNSRLSEFVQTTWDPFVAAQNSLSLNRSIRSLKQYRPAISQIEAV